MKIEYFNPKLLRNSAHWQYIDDFIRQIEECPVIALKIQPMHGELKAFFQEEDAAYKRTIKSYYTEQIEEAGKARYKMWKGLRKTISGATNHPDPAKREKANELKILMDTYGNIVVKSMIEQTADITNAVQDFRGAYASHVAALDLSHWILELDSRNIIVLNLNQGRLEESAAKNDTVMKDARERVDKMYQAIVAHINALAKVEGLADYEHFIRKLNANIAKYRLLLPASKRRKKRGSKPEAGEEGDRKGRPYI